MSTVKSQIAVSGYIIDVVRKDIKNLHLAVYPPTGRLRVAVPLHIDDDSIRLHIVSKLSWIKKQIVKFEKQERMSEREYVTGESHYYNGRRYLLNIVTGSNFNRVKIRNKTHIDLYVRAGTLKDTRQEIMNEWYRKNLKRRAMPLIMKWKDIVGVEVKQWTVRQMKTKWGSCNTKTGHIFVNLQLAQKPESCLEYIIVHELVHLLEKNHNDTFVAYMDKFLPDWRMRKDVLNSMPLSYSEWEY